ncbi:MAG: HAMP domain-containing protein, partial [Lachnospiraceae bacterium]|nr:HAMP domain-containing protein [Lachnospiraceae bacterium]
ADILAADPSILENDDNLDPICERLMVNELHIIDENGIITNSTVDAYVGFDMGSGEQSAAFLVIVDDPSIEIVQEPQQNAAEGIVVQYIGVARKDAPGLVQCGIQPEILAQTLERTAIDVVLADIEYGDKGYVFAIDKNEGTLLAHTNTALIGKPATEAGFPEKIETGSARMKIDGTSGYVMIEEFEDKYIGTFLPSSEYYSTRTSQMIVVSITMILIFLALIYVVNRIVDVQIISGIQRINSTLRAISSGDYSVQLNENRSPEFTELSDSINVMAASIQDNISHNEELLEKQKIDMENSLAIIENIKMACRDLEQATGQTIDGADSIEAGTQQQKAAIDDLEKFLHSLEKELNQSADETVKVTDTTEKAVAEIDRTREQLNTLGESINNINAISLEIEKIIDNINSIAGQTNLLALNASIEAARAGETGKGFAVVASQVGELAERSAEAAKETGILIQNSVNAVKAGKQLADDTAAEFENVVEIIRQVDTEVDSIAELVRGNVSAVSEAVHEIDKIETVVDRNVAIVHSSKKVSADMADITGQLLELVQ